MLYQSTILTGRHEACLSMNDTTVETLSNQRTRQLDLIAITISTLCLIHCVALPLSFLPLVAAVTEAHWLHQVFVLLATPATALVVWAERSWRFSLVALSGLALLFVSAFIEYFHDMETVMTMTGSVLLGGAHLWHRFAHRDEEDEASAPT
ncbi:MAG: MerC domain-containing protein [Pseudomonadota bacterium]